MTDEPIFDVIFRGDIAAGHQITTVKERLKSLFKVDDARIEQLFSGRPEIIKKNVDEATAHRYRDSLLKAGALVQLRLKPGSAFGPGGIPIPAVKGTAQAEKPPGSAQVGGATSGAAIFETTASGVTADAAPGDISASDARTEPELPESADGWTLAPVGADVLRPEERHQVKPVEIQNMDFELAPPGADLLNPGERVQVKVPEIDVSHLSVDMPDEDKTP